jgi:hypothetical protein
MMLRAGMGSFDSEAGSLYKAADALRMTRL